MATAHTPEQRTTSARIAAIKRHNPDADVSGLKKELETLTLEQRIAEYVAAAPLPTPEQRDRLAALLHVPEGASSDA